MNAAQGESRMTALHWAAMNEDAEMAQLLVIAGANLRATTRLGAYTPLFMAAKSGASAVVSVLLKAGADPKASASRLDAVDDGRHVRGPENPSGSSSSGEPTLTRKNLKTVRHRHLRRGIQSPERDRGTGETWGRPRCCNQRPTARSTGPPRIRADAGSAGACPNARSAAEPSIPATGTAPERFARRRKFSWRIDSINLRGRRRTR